MDKGRSLTSVEALFFVWEVITFHIIENKYMELKKRSTTITSGQHPSLAASTYGFGIKIHSLFEFSELFQFMFAVYSAKLEEIYSKTFCPALCEADCT